MHLFIVCRNYYDFEKNSLIIGGIQTYLRSFVRLAESQGYELTVLQLSRQRTERSVSEDGRIRVIGVPSRKKQFIRDLVTEAESLGDPEKDLLIFATSTQIVKHRFHNSVAIQHGIYWDTDRIHGKRPPYPVDLWLRAIQARRIISQHKLVSRMVCVDYNYVNWLRSLTVDRSLRYTVIPNMTKTQREPRPEHRGVRLIFARRFVEIRGVRLLMEFMPEILERYPEFSLTLAGSGPLESDLRERFAGMERVRFCIYNPDDSIAVHREHDIAIVPSSGSEGTSLSLLEAMAAGCVVVCSDVGGMSNLILDRFNGRILPPDPAAFRDAVIELLEDPALRQELANNGQRTIENCFSLESWEERWLQVLRSFEAK